MQGSKERDVKLDSIGCQRDSWAPPCSVEVRDIMEMINLNYQYDRQTSRRKPAPFAVSGDVRPFFIGSATTGFLRSSYLCSPHTYLHTHTRLQETKGAFGPKKYISYCQNGILPAYCCLHMYCNGNRGRRHAGGARGAAAIILESRRGERLLRPNYYQRSDILVLLVVSNYTDYYELTYL